MFVIMDWKNMYLHNHDTPQNETYEDTQVLLICSQKDTDKSRC